MPAVGALPAWQPESAQETENTSVCTRVNVASAGGRSAPVGLRGQGLHLAAPRQGQGGSKKRNQGCVSHGQLFCAPARIQSWISWSCAAREERAALRHAGPRDAGCAGHLPVEVAVVGIAGFHPHQRRLLRRSSR